MSTQPHESLEHTIAEDGGMIIPGADAKKPAWMRTVRQWRMWPYMAIMGGLLVTAVIAQQSTQSLSFISKASQDAATISIKPVSTSLPPDKTYQVWITSDKGVGFAKTIVTFDNTKLKLSDIPSLTDAHFDTQEVTSMETANQTGKIELRVGLKPTELANAPKGAFQFASLPFTANTEESNTQATIHIDVANSQIVGLSDDASTALPLDLSNEDATALINPLIATATQEPGPTDIPTPTHTPRPTNTPIPSITPTAAPNPTNTPIPSVTPSSAPTNPPSIPTNTPVPPPTTDTQGTSIVTLTVQNAIVGRRYRNTISGFDPTPNDTLTMTAQSTPPGLDLSDCQQNNTRRGTGISCRLSGTPTTVGTYNTIVTLTDAFGHSQSRTFALVVSENVVDYWRHWVRRPVLRWIIPPFRRR